MGVPDGKPYDAIPARTRMQNRICYEFADDDGGCPYELCEGDKFVLWRSSRGGIAATGRITGEAEFRDTPSPDRWEEAPGRAWFVPVAVDSWHDCVIPFKTLRADKRFDGMAFREMPGAPNPHPLTKTHWDALMSYL